MVLSSRAEDDAVFKSHATAQPQVAIITVTYNRAHTLAKAVDSVLSQGYPKTRLVLVDDGSTDGTRELLGRWEHDPRVEVARHETNRGMLAARNTALDRLTDEDIFFCYLDSDDTLAPNAVQTMVDAFRDHGEGYSIIWAASQDAASGQRDGWHSLSSPVVTYDDILADRLAGDFMEFVRHDLAVGLRLDPRARVGDHVLWAQLLRKKPALLIPDVVQLTDRSGTDRMSHTRYDRAYHESVMWSRMFELRVLGTDLRQAYPQRYATLVRELAQSAAMAGDGRLARLASRHALRLTPSLRTVVVACAALSPAWLVRWSAQARHVIRSRRGPASTGT